MKKTLLILFAICCVFAVYSQTLTLFTKPDCNNCKYTKHNLNKNEILFSEFSLDDKENAVMMLQKLKNINYTGKIYLPVIIESDSILLYPQENHNDSTLFFVVRNIMASNVPTEQHSSKIEAAAIESLNDADCDFNQSYQYLVCANFNEKEDAEKFKNVLLNEGYRYANVIFYNKIYRVYAMQVFEHENELYHLQELRKKYRGAYLLNIE